MTGTRIGGVARIAAASLALAAIGCGAVAEQATEEVLENAIEAEGGGDVELDSGDGTMTLETEDGTMTYGGGEVPAAIASVIDLPGDFVVEGALSVESADGSGSTVTGRMDGDIESAADDFAGDLESDGWTIDSRYTDSASIMLGASKGERTMTVTVLDDGSGDVVVSIYLA